MTRGESGSGSGGAVSTFSVKRRRILYVQFTDPAGYPPLEHSSRILAERGWEVVTLGVRQGLQDMQWAPHPRIQQKNVRSFKAGWMQKLQYLFFFLWILEWTWRWKPNWIYASDPLSAPVVWFIHRLLSVYVIYHEHDSPDSGQSRSWFMKCVLSLRDRLARDAALCVLPQRERLLHFVSTTRRAKPTFCVWNCPRIEEIPARVRDACDGDTGYPVVLHYHGNISPDLVGKSLLLAVSRFNGKVRLRIAGYEAPGSTGYLRELSRLAERYGVPRLIESLGTLSRRELFREASAAHIGMAMFPKTSLVNLRHMVGASNKAFDYMACSLPLLVSNTPEWIKMFVEPGYALACDPDNPASIEAALRWYIVHPNERREMGRKCREQICSFWNYETMFTEVVTELEKRLNDAKH